MTRVDWYLDAEAAGSAVVANRKPKVVPNGTDDSNAFG